MKNKAKTFTGTWRTLICVIAALTAMGAAATASAESSVEALRLPPGGIHPQVATDSRGLTHLIFFKGDPRHGDLFYERSSDGGRTFSETVRVNSQPGSVIVIGTIRGPQMAIGKGDLVHIAWMGSDTAQPRINGTAAPMLYTRTNDAGEGFEPQRNVIQSYPGLDGGGSIAADLEGNVYVAWHAPDSGATEADRRVWIARSRDDGRHFAPERAATADKTGACGCCGMRIAAGAGGRVYVLYRSASQMIHRDMHLLVSSDYGKTFKLVATHPWEVGQCVMSTASLLPTADGLLAAWETHEQIYVLKLDADKPAGPAVAVAGEAHGRKHPTLAINGRGEYVVAWTEGTGWNKGGSIAWQAFSSDGKRIPSEAGILPGLAAWNVPAVFVAPDDSFKIVF